MWEQDARDGLAVEAAILRPNRPRFFCPTFLPSLTKVFVSLVARDSYWRAIATRSRSSGLIMWSESSAASATSISTQFTSPVKSFGTG
jgi:hypothetical protein